MSGEWLAMGVMGAIVGASFLVNSGGSGSRDVVAMPQGIDRAAVADFEDKLSNVFAMLRGLRWDFWTTHWQVHGHPYYADHLLFERLYTDPLTKQIDGLGERMVAYFGADAVNGAAVIRRTARHVETWDRVKDPYQRALKAERDLQKAIKLAYDTGKRSGALTLGLDDFLMALANDHDQNIYLIQQRVKPR